MTDDTLITATPLATGGAPGAPSTVVLEPPPAAPTRRRARRRSNALPWLAVAWLAALAFVAVFGPLLTSYSPDQGSLGASLLGPGSRDVNGGFHLLGTDPTGRDVLMLLLYGARVSALVGLIGVGIAGVFGTVIGLVAGVTGRFVDAFLMRCVDVVLSIPPILLAILVAATMKPSVVTVFVVVGLLLWPNYARLVRGEVLVIRESDFVKLARVAGCGTATIMRRHVLPNVVPSILVLATLQVGVAIILESSLSFLGIGLPPTSASWGGLISQGLPVLSIAWWVSALPGLVIFLTVYSCNAVGDWARVKFDPRLETIA